jgi:glycosyltransferase involved in cell wall biosynthesis
MVTSTLLERPEVQSTGLCTPRDAANNLGGGPSPDDALAMERLLENMKRRPWEQVVEQVAALGLGDRIHFAGFLRGADVERAYRMADVYVLSSVSEPFGLTVLEAIQYGVPVILSKTSGVAEVLPAGVLRCDFWDTHDMAGKILAVLRHPELAEHLRQRAYEEIRPLTWDAAARKCLAVYREALSPSAYRSAG